VKTYVACIGEEAVLAFRAESDDDAHAMIDDEEGSIRSDLKVLVGTDEKAALGREVHSSGARSDGGTTCRVGAVPRPSNQRRGN
jgi:hypothetical protein